MATGNQGATNPIGNYNGPTVPGTVVQGARLSTDVQAARRRYQWSGEIKINRDVTPFLSFTEKLGNKGGTYGQAIVQHGERDMIPMTISLDAAGYNNSVTTLNFATGTGNLVVIGTVLKSFRTGEMFRVLTKPSADQVTVGTRGSLVTGGAAAAALLASEELQILGTAFGQNSTAPSGISVEPLIVASRLQTFRTAVEAAGRDMNSDVYGKPEWDRLKEDTVENHRGTVEKAFLFNQGYSDTEGTITDGMFNRIVTNVFVVNGVLDEITLNAYIKSIYRYNQGQSGKLVHLCGENFVATLDSFARDGIRFRPTDTMAGVQINTYTSGFGDIKYKVHGFFSPLGSSETAANGAPVGSLLTVNLNNVGKMVFKGRKFRVDTDVQLPGTDGVKDCITEDVGLEVWNERTHGKMTGMLAPF